MRDSRAMAFRRSVHFPTAIACVSFLAGCGAAPSAAPARPGPAQRIVSLNPCIDAVLVEVAPPGRIAGISRYSHDPRASSISRSIARRYPAVAAEADAIARLRPDLVLADSLTPAPTVAALQRFGIRVEQLPLAQTVAENRTQIAAIAALAGSPERGAALNARIDAALARTGGPGALPALIRQRSGLVPGAGTLPDELMRHVGLRNVAGDAGLGAWGVLPLERLVARPPALLLTDAGEGPAGLHPALRALGTRVTVAPLPMRLLNCGGPVIVPLVERLAAARDAAA